MIQVALMTLLLASSPLSCFELKTVQTTSSEPENLQILFERKTQGKIVIDYYLKSKQIKGLSQEYYPVSTRVMVVALPEASQTKKPDSVQVRLIKHSYSLSQSQNFFGSGPGQIREPAAITADNFDHIFVLDQSEDKIVKLSRNLDFLHEFGSFNWDTSQSFEDDFSSIEEAGFDSPRDLLASPDLTYFISDSRNDRIVEMDSSGNFVREFSPRDGFDEPTVLGITSKRELAVLDSEKERILLFNSFGHSIYQIGGYGRSTDRFSNPTDFIVHKNDEFFVLDAGVKQIKKYSRSSKFLKSFKLKRTPSRIALDPLGYLILVYPDHLETLTPDLALAPTLFLKPQKTKATVDLCFTTNKHLYILQNNPVHVTHWVPYFEIEKQRLNLTKD
jgi:hypothetical protein